MIISKFIKRTLSLTLACVLCTGLVACGEDVAEQIPVTEEVTPAVDETIQEEVVEVVEEAEPVEEGPEYELGVNLLSNGDFHNEMTRWGSYLANGGKADFVAPAGEGKVKIYDSGSVNYSVQAYYDGFELIQGGVYEFSFDIRSSIARNIESRIQINGGDYHAYVDNMTDITEDMQTYSYTFTMEEGSDPAPRLCFNLGTPDGASNLGEHEIYIDNVSLIMTDDSGIVKTESVDASVDINLNQVGFKTNARKTAVARNVEAGEAFDVVDVATGKSVYSGTFGNKSNSPAAGEEVCTVDFSGVNKPGTYKIVAANGATSYQFKISDDVYNDLMKDTFLFLYSQRCGMEIDSNVVGKFAHPACHTGKATVYGSNSTKSVTGGWHDAGDYGRYVVPGAITVADLFLAYEDSKSMWDSNWGDATGIPESGNKVPDILDEARYELDWMLQMQDASSGGVYHKISCKEFPGFVMPQDETDTLVLAPISNTATADFAAVMAKASVVYSDIDSAFAGKALDAAKKAWKYLEANPDSTGYRNPSDILTGEYPDGQDPDERYWASIELYKATGDDAYKTYFSGILDTYVSHGYGWAKVNSYGNMSYLNMDSDKQNATYVKSISDSVVAEADNILNNVNNDGYNCDLYDYSWGSNMTVSNNARILLDAYKIKKDNKYKDAAYNQLSYLLGQNALSMCYVTGYGTLNAIHAHHRPCIATGSVLPGMVIGGPNQNLEDPYAKATLNGVPAAKCYVDNDQSYSVNEVAIYWNSPFIYLLGYEMNNN